MAWVVAVAPAVAREAGHMDPAEGLKAVAAVGVPHSGKAAGRRGFAAGAARAAVLEAAGRLDSVVGAETLKTTAEY